MKSRSGLSALLLAASSVFPAIVSAAPLTVYDDQLRNGFADWSWATHNLGQTSVVHGGTAVASFEPDGTPPPAAVTVSIDPGADRHPISPLIYGVNFGSQAQAARLRWPVRRWGGNATTRYSWQHDISNHASDWFYYNLEEDNPNPGALPNGSAADVFIDQTRAAGGEPLITVPTIGWTPIDRNRRWGFSVSKYGAQQQTECTATGNPSWCQPDAGNGLRANGTTVTGNDPHDTSREIGPPFVTGWMAHIAARTGTAGQGASASSLSTTSPRCGTAPIATSTRIR